MLVTKVFSQRVAAFLADANVTAVGQKALNATVRISGTTPGGSVFTGSAVILGTGSEVAYAASKWKKTTTEFTVLLTAKHSLFVFGNEGKVPLEGSNAKWVQAYATNFKACTIQYTADNQAFASKPDKSAAINHVVPVFMDNVGAATKMITIDSANSDDGDAFHLINLTGTTTPDASGIVKGDGSLTPVTTATAWNYDVMILISKDPALYNYVNTPGNCDVMGGLNDYEISAVFTPEKYDKGRPIVPCMVRDDYGLVQTGFGMVSDTTTPPGAKPVGKSGKLPKIVLPPPPSSGASAGSLQVKFSPPLAQSGLNPFYGDLAADVGTIVLENNFGFLLDCEGGANSTFSGDSGGPLFAFPATYQTAALTHAYLIGVTNGAGVTASAGEAPTVWEYANNAATSLGPYFENLLDLRFQNV